MKKSITVIALAVMMLFAFTACEQKMPSYQQIEYVTLSQTQDFIVGQALTADAFEVTVHYLDGSEATYPGTGRVSFTEGEPATPATHAKDGVKASATIAKDKTDTITVNCLAPEAFTATVEVADYKKDYLPEGKDEATRPSDPLKVTVTGATVTAGNVSWVLSTEELKSVTASDVTLSKTEKVKEGTYTKETTVTYTYDTDEKLTYTTNVTVNVVRDLTNPLDPDYVETVKVAPLTKGEVEFIGVVWDDIEQDAFGTETTAATVTLDDVVYAMSGANTTASTTVVVGDTVEFTLVGLAKDMTNKLPLVLTEVSSNTGDYEKVGTSTIPTGATAGKDVTGIKYDGAEEETKALTATYVFVPDDAAGTPNFGLRTTITLTVTVDDKLDSSNNALTFHYDGKKGSEGTWTDKTIDPEDYKSGITLKNTDFNSEVVTEGKQTETIRASKIYGRSEITYTYDELVAIAEGDGKITVKIEYSYDGKWGKAAGTDEVEITVAKAPATT